MKKFVSAVLLAVAASGAMASERVIRFGVDPTFPPFETKTPEGSLAGFDIDLGNAICATLKARCVWVSNNFDGMIPALKAKKFDAILSAMYVNEKRLKEIAFTDKLYSGPSFLLAKTGSVAAPDVALLKGKHIGVEQGSVQETYVKAHWESQGVAVVAYQNSELVFQDLLLGRLDGAVMSGVEAQDAFLKTSKGKGYSLIGKSLTDPKIFGVGAAIGVRQGEDKLRQELNVAIATILKNGSYQKIAGKYFNFDIYNDN
ncbi:transporter substrate-binding domain-containing protein [Vogesella sp. LIG4]|uniref:transporter substrate-binding domain-containing protein n=1 Tax=Vogesella sp. LIG4 TaxID=1192162 RepID=UPI00082001A3|nr:transporter substrate-binding domain-containing protein [Vogesella sp. LIG4]SCK29721.1 lysine/arginine/ornithine transport system substrate-binding protein [Vogesella sp. LIG4]